MTEERALRATREALALGRETADLPLSIRICQTVTSLRAKGLPPLPPPRMDLDQS